MLVLGFDFQDDRNRTFAFKMVSGCLAVQELTVGAVYCCQVLCLRVSVSITGRVPQPPSTPLYLLCILIAVPVASAI